MFPYKIRESFIQNLLAVVKEAKTYTKRQDWPTITNKILQTQPPRYQDIPDMVEYCRCWAGLPSGLFVHDFAAACAHIMPSGRIVSGRIFQLLAGMKSPHDAMPSWLVNAILYVHVCAEESQDKFARHTSPRKNKFGHRKDKNCN